MPALDTSIAFTALRGSGKALGVSALLGAFVFVAVTITMPSAASRSQATAADFYVSPTGNDGGPCNRARPCASIGRAYDIARPGDTVELAGGTYPSQAIPFREDRRATGCSPLRVERCITLRPAKSAQITVDGNVEILGSALRWVGTNAIPSGMPTRSRRLSTRVTGYISVEASNVQKWPDHVVLDGLRAGNFVVGGSDRVVLRNMDIGPSTLDWNGRCSRVENRVGANGGWPKEPTLVTLDHVLIHNQNRTLAAAENDCHYGGLFLVSGIGITIRNSVFSQNVVYNIQAQNFGGGSNPSNVVIENNWFGCPVENLYTPNGETTCNVQEDIQFSQALPSRNWLIRFNSFGGGIGQYVPGASYENVRIVGNVGGDNPNCLTGVQYGFNAWREGQICSRSDVRLSRSPFTSTSPGREDFTLVRGARAIAFVAGIGADYRLRGDIDGRLRPYRYRADAGASQLENAAIVPARSIGSARLGMSADALRATYGAPRRSLKAVAGARRHEVRTVVYKVPRGLMNVSLSTTRRVVAVGTASKYYSTWGGVGPGTPANGRTLLAGARWVECLKAYRRVSAGRVTLLHADGERKGVTRVSLHARGYDPSCES